MVQLTDQEIIDFQTKVHSFFAANERDLPWRHSERNGSFDPYKIMVSEVMLQQTQVSRVIPKYQAFIAQFPQVSTLAQASLGDVLRLWQGLGYNRRAKFLWQTARILVDTYQGTVPSDMTTLQTLPGIGKNTAGAIMTYAFNRPVVFIETNIRTVVIQQFFKDQVQVSDHDIRTVVEQTIDRSNPRQWFWALMDYGSYIKRTEGNTARAATNYAKQTPFQGSQRQLRGHVLRLLSSDPHTLSELRLAIPDERLDRAITELTGEGFICKTDSTYRLA